MFTKYASLESAEVLDVKGSPSKAKTASLDKISEFDDYRTEDGFLYARIRAISSRVNKNHDGWPAEELAGGPEAFQKYRTASTKESFVVESDKKDEFGFSTFLGKPIFVDHHNSDPTRARGVIVDSKLHVEDHKTASEFDSYYSTAPENHTPPTWVELLLEVDAEQFPKLAKAIVEGHKNPHKGIDGFSMGADIEYSKCSLPGCHKVAHSPDEYCEHVRLKGAEFSYIDPKTGSKKNQKVWEDCYKISFFEISAVFDPADETALLRDVVHKEAAAPFDQDGEEAQIHERLEYLREELREERISQGELAELQGLAHYIDPGDVELLEAAGVPEGDAMGLKTPPEFVHPDDDPVVQLQRGLKKLPTTQHPLGDHTGSVNDSPDIHHFDSTKDAYDQSQTSGNVKDGDVLHVPSEGVTGVMVGAWPTAVTENSGEFHGGLVDGYDWNDLDGDDYSKSHETAQHLHKTGKVKVADNPVPQAELISAPEDVDTLRQEAICDICGSTMDSETCDVCGYTKPPEGFDNPDLSQAGQNDIGQDTNDPANPMGAPPEGADQSLLETMKTKNSSPTASVSDEWQLSHKMAAKVNIVERPIQPTTEPATNEPKEEIIKDETQPTTARTAKEFLQAVGRKQETRMSSKKVAADPVSEAKPDVKTDVEGVGAVTDGSNEQASKADAQVSVTDKGGTPVTDVSADQEGVNVAQGDEHSKNVEEIPTKTWSGTDGQHSPVTNDVFPGSGEGVTSGWKVRALDAEAFPKDDGNLSGGSAAQGTQPVDPSGKADDRVDVLKPVTTPENNSGKTDTWSGTNGNGVTKQQDPVTKEVYSPRSSKHLFSAFRLADMEVELGLIDEAHKYERVAELETKEPLEVQASLEYAEKVKKSSLNKTASTSKVAGRLPSMAQPTTTEKEASISPELEDAALFTR